MISLERIGRLDLIAAVYGSVVVPPAVAGELGSLARLDWIVEHRLKMPMGRRLRQSTLDPGEREAIALAIEIGARRVILDDLPARRFAQALALPVIGTIGVLAVAKDAGLLAEVRGTLEQLRRSGFRADDRVFFEALQRAGEST